MMSDSTQSTRRGFLQGKAAADALVELAADADAPIETPKAETSTYLVKLSRRAMACPFEFFFNAGQYPLAGELGLAALDLVDRLEDELSVFREHSQISRVNRHAAGEPVPVDEPFLELLERAVELHDETDGAFDVTAGPLSRAWGFTRRAGAMPDASRLEAALERVGSRFLELDRPAGTIRFLKPGVEINLGSIGKGYALDRCGELLAGGGMGDYLLHGGSSSVLARGAHGGRSIDEGWLVGVRDPLRPRRRLGQLRLRNRALATSGTGVQHFLHDERRYGHILDPRTGRPAEGVLSTTVIAPTAAEADALSTAFYVMGPAAAERYCQAHPEVGAIVLCPGTRAGGVRHHTFGIDQGDWIEGDVEP